MRRKITAASEADGIRICAKMSITALPFTGENDIIYMLEPFLKQ